MCCLTFFLTVFLVHHDFISVIFCSFGVSPSVSTASVLKTLKLSCNLLSAVCLCVADRVCVSLVAVQDWCQIQRLVWHCLVKQSMCVLRLGTCAGFLIKYAVGVNAAAEMPNRENQGGEERVGERLQNTSYHPLASIPCSLLFLSLHLSITPFHTFLSKPAPLLHFFPFNLYPTH